MALKTYYPQIENRKSDWVDYGYNILRYDWDNAYPQRVLELIYASPTASDCFDKRANFIEGNGFDDADLMKVKVNSNKLSVAKLLRYSALDLAYLQSFAWHINYNANFEIASINYVQIETLRMGNTENPEFDGRLALYIDWGLKSYQRMKKREIYWFFPFNPDPARVRFEVEASGGWDKYNGQIYYHNPNGREYPLAKCDSALEDIETDAGLKVFRKRNVQVGFMPSAILMKKSLREVAENLDPKTQANAEYMKKSEMDKDLIAFQGAENGQKILVMEYDFDEEKPELVPYPIQNNDKLFEFTTQAVASNIIRSFGVPEELIISEKGSSLKTGGEKKQAVHDFNDRTKRERRVLEEAFSEVMQYLPDLFSGKKFSIVPVPTDDITNELGHTAGQAINGLILSDLSPETKINTLIAVYGMTTRQAVAMIQGTEILQL